MIIPIRCMNCGKVLADKWTYYQERVKQLRGSAPPITIYIDGSSIPETVEKRAMDELGFNRYCCRKHFLTHKDLIDKI
jgi:DNA-directed RNA polymerase subunit N (RpoN/RPB10)